MAVGGDKKMFVFGRPNDREVESNEVEEGLSKEKVWTATGLDQRAGECLNKGGRIIVTCLVRMFQC